MCSWIMFLTCCEYGQMIIKVWACSVGCQARRVASLAGSTGGQVRSASVHDAGLPATGRAPRPISYCTDCHCCSPSSSLLMGAPLTTLPLLFLLPSSLHPPLLLFLLLLFLFLLFLHYSSHLPPSGPSRGTCEIPLFQLGKEIRI